MTALVPDVPEFCNVRGHYCRCDQRCDAERPALSAMPPLCQPCDHCKALSESYTFHPHCRECGDSICESCGTDYDAETNRITCNECAKEMAHG